MATELQLLAIHAGKERVLGIAPFFLKYIAKFMDLVSLSITTFSDTLCLKERPGYDAEPAPRLYSKRYLPGQNIHPGNCATGAFFF
jgi:hypothetical protein